METIQNNKEQIEKTVCALLNELDFQMKGYCIHDEDGNEHPVSHPWRMKLRKLGLDV